MTLKSMVQVFNNKMFMWSYLKTEKGLVFKCFVETFGIKGNNSYIYTKEEKQLSYLYNIERKQLVYLDNIEEKPLVYLNNIELRETTLLSAQYRRETTT